MLCQCGQQPSPSHHRGPYLVQPDNQGQITIAVKNCSPVDLELHRNDFIGSVENVQDCETREINPAYLQAVAQQLEANKPHQKLSAQKKTFIMDTVKIQVPEKYHEQYLKVLLHNHEAISQDKLDLGQTNTLVHEVALKSQEPIYVKQDKIPNVHCKEVARHVLEWLKLRVIQPACSRHNSHIFAVMKKDGNV